MKICYIVGANFDPNMPYPPISENDYTVAADGGYNYLLQKGIVPGYIVGDFDSLGYIPKEAYNLSVYPAEKNDTDMRIAYLKGLEAGCKDFVLFGGTGGRYDHLFANIQLLKEISEKEGRGFLFGDKTAFTVVTDGEICIPAKKNGNISVFSLTNHSRFVNIKGLKYQTDKITLTNSYALGVSNEFTGEDVVVSVKSGSLLVVWETVAQAFYNDLSTLFLR